MWSSNDLPAFAVQYIKPGPAIAGIAPRDAQTHLLASIELVELEGVTRLHLFH